MQATGVEAASQILATSPIGKHPIDRAGVASDRPLLDGQLSADSRPGTTATEII
jgi:hypothetical protein